MKDKVIELANGSSVRMGSVNTVDSAVGRSYNLIIFDEAAISEGGDEAFETALRPTLDRPDSKAIFISTPRGKNNWFSQYWNRGFLDEYPAWVSLQADYSENTRMSASDVEEARNTNSKAKFEQEYMASFVAYEGQIFNVTDDNIENFEPTEDSYEVIAGLDPGYKDPTAFIVIVYEHARDCYWIVDEYCEAEAVTATHVDRFRELIEKWGIESIFIDSAAAQFAADLAYTYDIATIRAKKDVLAGIANVQTLIQQNRLKIAPHCKQTIAYFDQYQWDDKETLTREKPKHAFSHIPDAVRYAIHTFTL
jgi:phage terminase large subunit